MSEKKLTGGISMVKKFVIVAVLVLIVLQGSSFAVESAGDVVFKDALYGLVIGAVVGGALCILLIMMILEKNSESRLLSEQSEVSFMVSMKQGALLR